MLVKMQSGDTLLTEVYRSTLFNEETKGLQYPEWEFLGANGFVPAP